MLRRMSLSRRRFVTNGLALSTLWATHLHAFDHADPRRLDALARSLDARPDVLKFADNPFTLGVASGDPWADSVVLWTRLAIDPLHGGGMPMAPATVTWEVASDDKMSKIVKRGTETATAEWAHSVHAEVTGLEADHWYWYRFRVGDHVSPIGRTRTMPKTGASVDRLKFAFASCQHYEQAYYTAYRSMASEDLDVVFFLGDYIYEGAPIKDRPRLHVGPELTTLQDYRDRYAQYKMDPLLQAAHANAPWIMTWDDHEVANNYANLVSAKNDPTDIFTARRAAAYHAYYEHQPMRKSSMPHNASAQMYRQFQYGTLASFFVLDTRQFRDDQPCDDGTKPLCAAALEPTRTIMGPTQKQWLYNGLDRSRTAWNVIPQQVMMGAVDQGGGGEPRYSMDQWPGYFPELMDVMGFLERRKPANPVVLTGDIHSNWVNDLKADFRKPQSATVGTELVVTSISSGGDGSDFPQRMTNTMNRNPFVKFYNGQRGYVSCVLTAKGLQADYKVVDKATLETATVTTKASFHIESGKPGAEKA